MRLAALVSVADEVATSPARTAKRAALAGLLRDLAPQEVEAAVGMLVGDPRQGRLGVGWATVASIPVSAGERSAPLDVGDLDAALDRLAAAGSARTRAPTCSVGPRRPRPTSCGGSSWGSCGRVHSRA